METLVDDAVFFDRDTHGSFVMFLALIRAFRASDAGGVGLAAEDLF